MSTVLGAGALITWIERSIAAFKPEIPSVPEWHQSKHAGFDTHYARRMVTLQQVQFLKPHENPEWEIDLDT
jgi:hypothetical protein